MFMYEGLFVHKIKKRSFSQTEEKNKFSLPVKGSEVTNQLKSLWFDPFWCITEMRDDWFRRGHRLPSLLSISSKSCSHTFLHPLINSVARSFVNQMHLNRFFLFPSPLSNTVARNPILLLDLLHMCANPKQMQRIQLRLKEAEYEEVERERENEHICDHLL